MVKTWKDTPHSHTQQHVEWALQALKDPEVFERKTVSEWGWVSPEGYEKTKATTKAGPCHSGFSYSADGMTLYFTVFKEDSEATRPFHKYLCEESVFAPFIVAYDLETGAVLSPSLPAKFLQIFNIISRYSGETHWACLAFNDFVEAGLGKHLAFWMVITSHMKPRSMPRDVIGGAKISHTLAINVPFQQIVDNLVDPATFMALFDGEKSCYEAPRYGGVTALLQGENSGAWWSTKALTKVFGDPAAGVATKGETTVSPVVNPFEQRDTYATPSSVPSVTEMYEVWLPHIIKYVAVNYPHLSQREEEIL